MNNLKASRKMEFMGFRRKDGSVGTRNYVGIFSTVLCANEVAENISREVNGTAYFVHNAGCCQTPPDIRRTEDVLIALGKNPNLRSVLLVSLGCESTIVSRVSEEIAKTGKRVEVLVIQDVGGSKKCVGEGMVLAERMAADARQARRERCPAGDMVLGLKCGASDTISGLVPNPALGLASDLHVAAGGTSILGEVTEFIGAEHILAAHAATPEIAQKIYGLVSRMEARAKSMGTDIRGGQPTEGNIKGGLTTIEEKSLGAIAKAGTAPIIEVCEYGVRPSRKGLVVMDSPGREAEILTGLAAAGCNVICFSTGRGAPQGFSFVPVIKVSGSKTAMVKMCSHIDLDLSDVLEGGLSLSAAADLIYEEMLSVSSGTLTKSEISGYTHAMGIYTLGPVI